MPAAPSPAIALPTMKAAEFGEASQMAEPTSNNRILEIKTSLIGKRVYILPNNSWNAQHVSKYALPYQPTSGRELNSSVI
jgi:hypothetical protein